MSYLQGLDQLIKNCNNTVNAMSDISVTITEKQIDFHDSGGNSFSTFINTSNRWESFVSVIENLINNITLNGCINSSDSSVYSGKCINSSEYTGYEYESGYIDYDYEYDYVLALKNGGENSNFVIGFVLGLVTVGIACLLYFVLKNFACDRNRRGEGWKKMSKHENYYIENDDSDDVQPSTLLNEPKEVLNCDKCLKSI